MKIIGLKIRQGVYNDKEWKAYDVYYQTPIKTASSEFGVLVEKVSFNEKGFQDLLAAKNINDKQKLLGLEFNEIYYNSYRKPVNLV